MPARSITRAAMQHAGAAVLSAVLILGATGVRWASSIARAAPEADLSLFNARQSVRITDRDGNVLYRYFDREDRENLSFDEIPQVLKDAFVAIEDERFFTRDSCVDVRAIARAAFVNATTDRIEGASTITQQLARSLFLSPEKTFDRKIKEITLACDIERSVSREDILETYMNQVAYVGGAHGVERAAQLFFRTSARNVTLAQAAVLAAIPQRNGYYNPYGANRQTAVATQAVQAIRRGELDPGNIHPDDVKIGLLSRVVTTPSGTARIRGRAELVLDAMEKNNMITAEERDAAAAELPSMVFLAPQHPIDAPHFTLRVRDELRSLLNHVAQPDAWLAQGLEVRTTIDPALQRIAQETALRFTDKLREAGAQDMALVAIDRQTRQVLAYIGNAQFDDEESGQIDMASVPRQPGSSFKPIVYTALFELGYGPDTFINDTPLTIGNNTPKNYDGGFRGRMTIRDALSQSRNIPAIRAYQEAGGEDVILTTAAAMGATTPLAYKEELNDPSFTYGWPMAIGSAETPLIEMVQAYATIAENGVWSPLRDICDLSTDDGGLIGLPLQTAQQAIQPEAAQGVHSILTDAQSKPQGYWRSILTIDGMTTGAKTGTSNICLRRDAKGGCRSYGVSNIWTIGYGPRIVAGVWAGNADGSPLAGPLVDGLTEAAPIWKEFLQQAEEVYAGPARCS